MPRFNVELDGKWACYSTINEGFVTKFMPLKQYEKWRDEEYGKGNVPLDRANQMTFTEALKRMSIYNSKDYIFANLEACGLIERMGEDCDD